MTWWQDRLKNGSWTPGLAKIERAEMDRACSMPVLMAQQDFFAKRYSKYKSEGKEECAKLCSEIANSIREQIIHRYAPGQLGYTRGVEVHPLLSHDMTDYQIKTAVYTAHELMGAEVPLGYDYTAMEELRDGKALATALLRDHMTDVEKQQYTI